MRSATLTSRRGPDGRRRRHRLAAPAVALLLLTAAGPVAVAGESARDFVQAVRADTRGLCAWPSRLVGSPGHEQARQYICRRLAAMPGVKLVSQSFTVMVPRTRRARLRVESGPLAGTHRVYPLWPDSVRLNTTPASGISGRPVYIGKGGYASLPPRSLRGNIAVYEMSAYDRRAWSRAFDLGARAVILLGSREDATARPADVPFYKPRFYLPPGPLAVALRAGRIESLNVSCAAAWQEVEACNLVAVLPGTAAGNQPRPLLLVAGYDAMSVVPDLAPGADNAVDAALLLNLLEYFCGHRPRRGLVVAFVDAFGIARRGMRELLAMLSMTPDDVTRKAYEDEDREQVEEYGRIAAQVEALGADPAAALVRLGDKAHYGSLQRYLKHALSPEILRLREETGKLRLARHAARKQGRKLDPDLEQRLAAGLERLGALNRLLSGIILRGRVEPAARQRAAQLWRQVRERVRVQLAGARRRRELFAGYDRLRAQVMNALGREPHPQAPPFPFVLGVDLSDSGINVGPSLWDEHEFGNRTESARDFLRWLKGVVQPGGQDPFAVAPPAYLRWLGLPAAGIARLVKRIINLEAIQGTDLAQAMREDIPGVSDEVVANILRRLRSELRMSKERPEAVARRILEKELPDLPASRARRLARSILNLQAIEASTDPRSFATDPQALLSGMSEGFRMKGVTWSTLEGLRLRLDTPQDTCARLRWERLAPQLRVTALVLERAIDDPAFDPETWTASGWPQWRMPHGNIVSETVAETTARTPAAGMLVTSVGRYWWHPCTRTKGVRGIEFVRTGADGGFRLSPMHSQRWWRIANRVLQAFVLAPDGRIVKGISKSRSMISGRIASNFNLGERPPMKAMRAVAFDCVEVNGPVFRDPRYQTHLNGFKLIDVDRGGLPKRYYWSLGYGRMFGLLPPGTHWQLILRYGTANNRMALLNVAPDLNRKRMSLREGLAHGFAADVALERIPELISARDFHRIDEWRLRRLERAGVNCRTVRHIHARTAKRMAEAEITYARDDGAGYRRASVSALADEIRVYHAVQAQANDVARGAIFLLLLLVPFSAAMERLLFAATAIGRQIAGAMLVFAMMAGVLWSFHPGFRISNQPAVILLAFLVLLLSLAVIVLVMRKFRADMEELRRGTRAEASGAKTGRAGVIASAVWLGITNMRKRPLRTVLTGVTIVLVTFALLCFTSSSTYQEKRVVSLPGVSPPYAGVLVQHPAMRAMERATEEEVANQLGDAAAVSGRYWVISRAANWRLHVRNARTGSLASLKAGLGLRPQEDRLTHVSRFLPGWERFGGGGGCYLSRQTAAKLGLVPGDEVVVAGVSLKLLGTFDAAAFERGARKMDGAPLLPIDFTVERDDWTLNQQAIESELADGNMLLPDPDQTYVSADETVILPVELARRLRGELRSVGVLPRQAQPRAMAARLMEFMVFPVYYDAGGKVKAMVSTPLIPRAPRKLLVPIVIAALIIFNTMLNSIAERKREIHIYTSLGLAPRHIGVLFLAEAMTYGLMGAVGGYVVGQGTAKVLTGMDLMGGITLNYSGTSVILTMGLVLAVVMVSSLVPAYMAARIASPSSDLDWKVPQPEQGVIRDLLPFTVSTRAAPGLAAFLHDYFDAHCDGAIGNFTSSALELRQHADGETLLALQAVTWLAPYDLGVRQRVLIEIKSGAEDICSLRITLTHEAGPERSWWRLNRTFLGDLRRQLLGWRNVAPTRMLAYIRQARSLAPAGAAGD